MAAPERFAEMTDFPLAPRAPSIHGTSVPNRMSALMAALGAKADLKKAGRLDRRPYRPYSGQRGIVTVSATQNLTRVSDCVTSDQLAHVKDASRLTAAGGASAAPADGGSSLPFPGGSGISLPAL